MKIAILIPARYESVRYPGKPLVALTQADGTKKSLIQMSWEAARKVTTPCSVYILTDDDRILKHAESFGANVIMTSKSCKNGTERCAEVIANGKVQADLIVNFQGDAPLTPPWFVDELINAMKLDGSAFAATPVLRCDLTTYMHLLEDRKQGRVGGTTAVFDKNKHALYFSKEVLPYIDPKKASESGIPVFHHVGIYAYRPEALARFKDWPVGTLEALEGLEQVRFLENGHAIACVEVESRGRVFWELNNPEDVARIETVLKEQK